MLNEAKSRLSADKAGFAGKKIIFASKNEGKVREVRHILAGVNVKILSLNDVNYTDEIEETAIINGEY